MLEVTKTFFLELARHVYAQGLIKLAKELIFLSLICLKNLPEKQNCEILFLFPIVCLKMSKEINFLF